MSIPIIILPPSDVGSSNIIYARRKGSLIKHNINELLNYGLKFNLIAIDDVDYVANQLIDLLQIDTTFEFRRFEVNSEIDDILADILDYAVNKEIIENDTIDERDLFDTRMMGYLTPRPSEINTKFAALYAQNPKAATDYYYDLSKATNYIRTGRIKKDKQWKVDTGEYGVLDLTINLSKPEKDPKTIALAKSMPSSGYPACVLCKENVGYAGHLSHPARQNHRIIPVELNSEQWYLQYSPYVYYNEHCIILKEDHVPMAITRETFENLLCFVDQFKHYFAGSNADLPIVGGSILSHDHFQGGSYTFAMDNAKVLQTFEVTAYPDIRVELLKWPLTTLRLKGTEITRLADCGDHILKHWRAYSDESLDIHAFTDETPHNTITPITRYRDGFFELDLVLRNNRTSDVHPAGIFHPHAQYHHLKKENIGLIEVLGLAILPGRLVEELDIFKQALLASDVNLLVDAGLAKHVHWFDELVQLTPGKSESSVEILIERTIGLKFLEILACCGVYKLNEAGLAGVGRLIDSLNGVT